MKHTLHIFIALLFLGFIEAQAQNADSGDIPKNRLAISGWKDIKFNGSGNWKTVDVTTKGIRPNTNRDMAPEIQKMIKEANGKTIFKFPAGNYKINSSIRVNKSDFQIIGSGKSTKFLFRGGDNAPSISVAGKAGKKFTLQNSIKRGDNKITLASTSGLSVGDYLFIAQQNGGRNHDIDNQIVKILAKNGNQLTIDMKMGLDFQKSKARVQQCLFQKNVKFSNFYMERMSQPKNRTGQITFSWVQNAELSKIESKKVLISHLTVNNSRDVLVFQNNLYGNFGFKRSGGYNYGVTLNRCTRTNVINNKMSDLRHHIALQFGSDHCVIAYNRTTIYNHYADYGQHNSKGCHNNLFEGNYGEELFDDNNKKAWGTPHTVWFRNHAIAKIGSEYPNVSKHAIIGNEIKAGANGIKKGNGKGDFFIGANIVDINKENGSGKMLWGKLNSKSNIPPSLFLTKKPSYLNRWPFYGPKTGDNPNPNQNPSVSFKVPSGNLTVKEGYASLRVEANANDKDGNIANVQLYIGNKLIREEKRSPYEWGHKDFPNELRGLKVGKHTFKVTATDNKGAKASDTFTLTVEKKGDPDPNPSDCKFGTPLSMGIKAKNKITYNKVYVVGSGGPKLTNFRKFTINWNPTNNGIYQFAINTNNGTPDWYVDFKDTMTFQLKNAKPEVALQNTGFAGLDGSYWVAETSNSLILVSKTKDYSIHFSNAGKKPTCANKVNDITKRDGVKIESNPFDTSLSLIGISDDAFQVVLFDYSGKRIATVPLTGDVNSHTINTGYLPTGIYFVKVLFESREPQTIKVMKR